MKIQTESDYHKALERIEQIMNARPRTPEGDELERLSIEVEKYEHKHYPLPED